MKTQIKRGLSILAVSICMACAGFAQTTYPTNNQNPNMPAEHNNTGTGTHDNNVPVNPEQNQINGQNTNTNPDYNNNNKQNDMNHSGTYDGTVPDSRDNNTSDHMNNGKTGTKKTKKTGTNSQTTDPYSTTPKK